MVSLDLRASICVCLLCLGCVSVTGVSSLSLPHLHLGSAFPHFFPVLGSQVVEHPFLLAFSVVTPDLHEPIAGGVVHGPSSSLRFGKFPRGYEVQAWAFRFGPRPGCGYSESWEKDTAHWGLAEQWPLGFRGLPGAVWEGAERAFHWSKNSLRPGPQCPCQQDFGLILLQEASLASVLCVSLDPGSQSNLLNWLVSISCLS